MAVGLAEQLETLLRQAQGSVPGLEASALVSMDGLIIVSSLPPDIEEDRVAAMTAAMLGLGERTADELSRGMLDQIYIKGPNGYVLIMAAGDNAVLTAIAGPEAKLGLLLVYLRKVVSQIEALLL
ncbi:MAG TPA: roadblock/LC7 domain-containing protein [Dissulfurispiraceae bacterium]|nr:roadblock/LC7 domain-containing protein [Dissulfurispiraceae bacterium]